MKNNFGEPAAIRLGKNKNTPADALSTLIGHSAKVDRLVAKHPHSDGATLNGLSGSNDKTTIKNLLLNPNTSDETILEIASRCPQNCRKLLHDFFKNPNHKPLAIKLVKDKNATECALGIVIGLYTPIDRLIAKHSNAGRLLDQLSKSKDRITRRNVFLNPNSYGFTAQLAPEFPDEFPKLPAQILSDLIIEHSECILGIGQAPLFQILSHPKCPPLLLDWACKRGGLYEQLAVWKNPSAPAELLREMMVTGYPQEANVLLALPEKILELLNGLGFAGSPPKSYEELYEFHGWLDNMSGKTTDLWDKLVPEEGEAETVQGEMVRAIGRIQGDYYQNGFGNWHQCYELSRLLADHLADENTFNPFTAGVIRADIRALDLIGQWCMYSGNLEQTFLSSIHDTGKIFQRLDAAIVVWCERHPEPIPYNQKK